MFTESMATKANETELKGKKKTFLIKQNYTSG